MPELAEVETIRLGLAQHLLDARVEGLEGLHPRVSRHQDLPYEWAAGRRVAEVARRGKFLWCTLVADAAGVAAANDVPPGAPSEPLALLFHLGMSGQLLVDSEIGQFDSVGAHGERVEGGVGAAASDRDKHLRARLVFSDAAGEHLLRFVDQRTFGYVSLCRLAPTPDGQPGGQGTELAALPTRAAGIARDALDPYLDVAQVADAVRSSRTIIKSQLLDQGKVSGIGNIYADEALARAGIHPTRPGNSLSPAEVERLLEAAAQVLRAAIEVGGTSFDALYVDAAGNPGYFARELWAYGRYGQPCRRCGTSLERSVLGGRSATFCPACQV